MDRVPQETRSAIMSKVRGRNTKPEMLVRSVLHRLGFRFRLHGKNLPGTPDIVFPSRRAAIFVHGCFWHQHPGCRKASIPETRRDFWLAKLQRNVDRDAENVEALAAEGWKVLTVWECETKDMDLLSFKLDKFLSGSTRRGPHLSWDSSYTTWRED
ncbi:very short patch repair endonuclease [Rhizobium leguminosarum]|uniref:very short patch repair endonuclease n=1 Tax=Rhizobium leguminosarum TaxID=384 RepID=UPI003F9831D6